MDKNVSAYDEVASKLKKNKKESSWRFEQRILMEVERYIHLNAMANGYRHQYVKPKNRIGYLKGLDGFTLPKSRNKNDSI